MYVGSTEQPYFIIHIFSNDLVTLKIALYHTKDARCIGTFFILAEDEMLENWVNSATSGKNGIFLHLFIFIA